MCFFGCISCRTPLKIRGGCLVIQVTIFKISELGGLFVGQGKTGGILPILSLFTWKGENCENFK